MLDICSLQAVGFNGFNRAYSSPNGQLKITGYIGCKWHCNKVLQNGIKKVGK